MSFAFSSRASADRAALAPLREIGLFADLSDDDLDLIHAPIDQLQFRAGQNLYLEGGRAAGLYSLQSGLVKLARVTEDGRQRVTRIVREGEIAGLEALATSRYDSDAIALNDVTVHRIPLEVVHRLSQQSPRLHPRLMQQWRQALRHTDNWLASIKFGSARQRVRQFVLKMRDAADPAITLLFSREDMGAMMDLKHETVSREVSQLVREGALQPLDKSGRVYRVQNPQLLAA